jgi:hypothetical protein
LANLLAIDWDHRRLHVAAVRTGRKGSQVEKTLTWEMPEDLTPARAEHLGKLLREFLKTSGVSAPAALIGLARDRVLVKDVYFPAVGANEEPNLVRFQVGKELTDAVDGSVIDYVRLNSTRAAGERHVLAVIARKDVVNAAQALCKAAGLKLVGLAPRLFGAPYALERGQQPDGVPPGDLRATLSMGAGWAELGLYRGHEPILARSLAAGATLAREVRRTLTVFAAQHAAELAPGEPRALYVFGNGENGYPALQDALGVRVEPISPFTIADAVRPAEKDLGSLAGVVGLAHHWALTGGLPVNLAAPKKAQAQASPTRRRWVVYGSVAAVLLVALLAGMYYDRSKKRAELTALTLQKNDLEDQLRKLAQDKADIDDFKAWEQTTIPWVDELYDLSARFPYQVGLRINHLATEATGKRAPKDKQVAKVRISGTVPPGQEALVHQFADAMTRDGHIRATVEKFKGQEFSIKVEVNKQPRDSYQTVLIPPAAVPGDPAMEGDDDAEGGDQ